MTIVHELAVQRVLHGFGQPRNTAGRPDGGHAYVTDEARHEVVTLELPGGRIVHRTPVGGQVGT